MAMYLFLRLKKRSLKKEVVVCIRNLSNGHTMSCGCMKLLTKNVGSSNGRHKHGMWKSPEFLAWQQLLSRCSDVNNAHYINYGGRGISVCKRWLGEDGFINFYNDMGPRPLEKLKSGRTKYSIDRINNNGNYEPDNCAWRVFKDQINNRRGSIWLTYENKTLCVSDWEEIFRVSPSSIYHRLRKGEEFNKIAKYFIGKNAIL